MGRLLDPVLPFLGAHSVEPATYSEVCAAPVGLGRVAESRPAASGPKAGASEPDGPA
jgi:hypothetical protein